MATFAGAAVAAVTQQGIAQRLAYSTHDWVNAGNAVPETWADVKTPGNGRTYAVGTVKAIGIANGPFSGQQCGEPGLFPGQEASGGRQVVVLQCTGDATGIEWQRYFYGRTVGQPGFGLSTFARCISVSVGTDPASTRVAIGGDTYDAELPLLINAFSFPATNNGSGFVAMYDGNGSLLWTYKLAGQSGASTTVTDIVIRYDPASGHDVVTYCGCSREGGLFDPANPNQSSIRPVLPFAAPPPPAVPCPSSVEVYAGGDSHNSPAIGVPLDNWDGMVGRFSVLRSLPVTATLHFHSIVGGVHEDGLFGLAEISANRFAVVGQTYLHGGINATTVFPLTRPAFRTHGPICLSDPAISGSCLGVLMVFDAANVYLPTAGALSLVGSTLIGSAPGATLACDVVSHGDLLHVVGSTDDPQFTSGFPAPPIPGLSGRANGYLVCAAQDPNHGFVVATYVGRLEAPSTGSTGAVGVAAWPEYPDHVMVSSWNRATAGALRQIEVSSFFLDISVAPTPTLRMLRLHPVATTGDDVPSNTTQGFSTTWVQHPFPTPFLAFVTPEGGGLGVDSRGLVTVVGANDDSLDFPVLTSAIYGSNPESLPRGPGPGHGGQLDPDGVRTVLNMLPEGVCRTDRSGCSLWTATPGYAQDTTPTCALVSNGGSLLRMFLDFEGVPAGGANVAVLLDRPPLDGAVNAGLLYFGLPSTTTVLVSGVELWGNGAVQQMLAYGQTSGSLRLPFQLPPGPQQFTIQFLTLMWNPLCGSQILPYAASSALLVTYP